MNQALNSVNKIHIGIFQCHRHLTFRKKNVQLFHYFSSQKDWGKIEVAYFNRGDKQRCHRCSVMYPTYVTLLPPESSMTCFLQPSPVRGLSTVRTELTFPSCTLISQSFRSAPCQEGAAGLPAAVATERLANSVSTLGGFSNDRVYGADKKWPFLMLTLHLRSGARIPSVTSFKMWICK